MALHGLYSINQIMEILDDLGTPMTKRSVQRRLKNRSIDHAGNANLYTTKTVTDLIHAEGPDSYKEATPGQIKADQIRVNLLKNKMQEKDTLALTYGCKKHLVNSPKNLCLQRSFTMVRFLTK